MRLASLFIIAVIAASAAFAQQNNAPQRTITTRSESTVTSDPKPAPGTPSNQAAALEQYRQMWQKMTPAQQKALVSAGGLTPEQYERKLTGATAPDSSRTADSGALDSLSKSLQDLNAIRDANLSLVQKDGCAPELASRIADLKAKLRNDEFELNGAEAPQTPIAAHTEENASAADPLAIANEWFRHTPDPKQVRPDDSNRVRESRQLDAVLSGTQAPASPERRIEAKSPEAEQNRRVIEADMARVKSELEELSSACAAAKK